MPSDDYKTAIRGGLKLKGSSSSGITKKKKKDKKPKPDSEALSKAITDPSTTTTTITKSKTKNEDEDDKDDNDEELDLTQLEQRDSHDGKTATERAYDETRRKRLQQRLEREGPKTHKQRVEDLNKYLSTLSEHHDMPRIGPG